MMKPLAALFFFMFAISSSFASSCKNRVDLGVILSLAIGKTARQASSGAGFRCRSSAWRMNVSHKSTVQQGIFVFA